MLLSEAIESEETQSQRGGEYESLVTGNEDAEQDENDTDGAEQRVLRFHEPAQQAWSITRTLVPDITITRDVLLMGLLLSLDALASGAAP
ncbi:hypothetical protein CSHISOI_11627, partial [Colletotrichum shisoi]